MLWCHSTGDKVEERKKNFQVSLSYWMNYLKKEIRESRMETISNGHKCGRSLNEMVIKWGVSALHISIVHVYSINWLNIYFILMKFLFDRTTGCPIPGCRGIGHIKGSKFVGHHSEYGCPYSVKNLDSYPIQVFLKSTYLYH